MSLPWAAHFERVTVSDCLRCKWSSKERSADTKQSRHHHVGTVGLAIHLRAASEFLKMRIGRSAAASMPSKGANNAESLSESTTASGPIAVFPCRLRTIAPTISTSSVVMLI